MTPHEFAVSSIGRPWRSGADGPHAYDCWGLVRAYYRHVLGLDVPAVDVDATRQVSIVHAIAHHPERDRWVESEAPVEGAAVLMSQAARPHHVGVYVAGAILHALEGAGVVWQDLTSVRIAGWRVVGYYVLR